MANPFMRRARSCCCYRIFFLLLGAFLIWGSVGRASPPAHRARILLQPRNAGDLVDLLRIHRGTVLRSFPAFRGMQVVSLRPGEDPREIARRCRLSGCAEFAEPDYRISLNAVLPNDPSFQNSSLWGLHNTGQQGGVEDCDIDAPEAWALQTGAPGVVVAIIDTGIRATHEDLAGNLWTNPQDGSHGFNALTGSNLPEDDAGHGTSIAGIIGAVGNNGVGVAGICWQVQIMACKFADASGGFISDAISCLDFARTNGAQVINTSWGLYEESQALSNALARISAEGIVVVAAAGNDAIDIDASPYYPAAFPFDNLVSVGGITRSNTLYDLSNFGAQSVDLVAPALEIFCALHRSDADYGVDQGTSLAAAYVSGAAVQLRARFSLAPASWIVSRILGTVDLVPELTGVCGSGGRLNLRRALQTIPEPFTLSLSYDDFPSMSLLIRGEPQALFVLEGSKDLLQWDLILTNLLSAQGTWQMVTNPTAGNAQMYLRAHY